MQKTFRIVIATMAIVMAISAAAYAAAKPAGLVSDNAVLQRSIRVPIWGTADDGEKITVKFLDQEVSTTARNGRWMLYLKPLKAGGPYTMTINDLELKNIMVGEVWVCSGQSNMAWQMARVDKSAEAIAAAKDPNLRLFSVPKLKDRFTLTPDWKETTPENVTSFSAVGYYFGKYLRETLKVPVGLIDSSVGGTAAESWTARRYLQANPMLATSPAKPSYLYNAMIAPLQPYAIKGAIWYQGEANAGRAYQYRTLLPTMIKCWRDAWGQGDFPFLIVQLAPYGKPKTTPYSWPELREAQYLTTKAVPNAGMVVITDYGNCENIHPVWKDPVGYRLSLAARAIAYGQKIPYSGPIYTSMKLDAGKVILSFDHVYGGLEAKGGELKGFTIAGGDESFVPAKAEIKGDTVVVSSPDVANPVAVRYGWEDCPDVNLFNKAGLPASPFRTDSFEMVTKPK